jgi:hypothetical protein
MLRERALKIVLVLVGLLFSAAIYPVVAILREPHRTPTPDTADAMMMSVYFALGIFLLLAARNPAEHRSLIAFTAWSSFAHGAVMAVLAIHMPSERTGLLIAVAVLIVIGVALIAMAPAKLSSQLTFATSHPH